MAPSIASNIKRGLFIVLEGCDHCGKSTQSKMLVEYLERRKIPVKHMVFPERQTEIGTVINAYLRSKQELSDQAIHLLFSANRWEAIKKMKTLLESGVTLVVDRYSFSGVAYSVAKGLNFEWCWSPEKGLLRPDVVLYLNAPLDDFAQRGDYGVERYEKIEFQRKVADVFDQIYKSQKHYWTEINAATSKDYVHNQIVETILKMFSELEDQPLKTI